MNTTTPTADAPVMQAVDAAGAEAIQLSGGFPIADADFGRAGPDLVLTAPNGEQVVVRDFFSAEQPPKLTLPEGAEFSGALAAKLAGPQAPAQVAQAGPVTSAQPIGTVENLVGTVTVTRADGTQEELETGDPVFQGDILESGEDGAIGIVFADETSFSMAENGRMVLDEMIYDPGAGEGSMSVSVVKGVFTFVSGQIAKADPEAMSIETPVATIGIRGTQGGLDTGTDGQILKLLMMTELVEQPDGSVIEVVGELQVSIGGQVYTINQADFGLIAGADGVQTRQFTPQEIVDGFAQALGVMPSGGRPMNRYGVEERGGDDVADFDTAAGEEEAPPAPDVVATFTADAEVTDAGLDLGDLILSVTPVPEPDVTDPDPIDPVDPTPPIIPDPEPEIGRVVKVGDTVFLRGDFLEVGITNEGDTIPDDDNPDTPPDGWHPTSFTEGGIGGRLSYVVDHDGFDQGNGPIMGDVAWPGSPEDNTTIGFAMTDGGATTTVSDTAGSVAGSQEGDTLKATSEVDVGGMLQIDQVSSFGINDTFMRVDVTVTNTYDYGLYDIRYMRNIDPDQESGFPGGAGSSTLNDVLSNPDGGSGNVASVQATGPNLNGAVQLIAMDENARASAFGFTNEDPYDPSAFDTPADPNGASGDIGINLVFDLGDLMAGESTTFTYYWSALEIGSKKGNIGNDMFTSSGGGEILEGGGGNDMLFGLGGDDTFIAGAGDDNYDGGVGSDTVSFENTTGGVNVNLGDGTASGVETGDDSLTDFENAIGGSGNDVLVGDGDNNVLKGGGGDDILTGGGDNDVFEFAPGDGNDAVTDFDDGDTLRFESFGEGFVVGDVTIIEDGDTTTIIASNSGATSTVVLENQAGVDSYTVTKTGVGSIEVVGETDPCSGSC